MALMMAMALPDMCAALESNDGLTNGQRYRKWYDKNMQGDYLRIPVWTTDEAPLLSAEDCYRFRCSLLHQGRTSHDRAAARRLIFVEPGKGYFHLSSFGNEMQEGLSIDLPTFVTDMTQSVRRWLDRSAGTEPYESNMKSFIRRRQEGIGNMFVGIPVIA